MSGTGQTEEVLLAGQAALYELIAFHAGQQKKIGEAQGATESHDELLEKLGKVMAEFLESLTIELAGKSQLLEQVGIVEPS